jgi:hypothetical protein
MSHGAHVVLLVVSAVGVKVSIAGVEKEQDIP